MGKDLSRGIECDFPRLGTFWYIPWDILPRQQKAKYFQIKVTAKNRGHKMMSQLQPTRKLFLTHTFFKN